MCRKFNGGALRISTWERGTAAEGEGELQPDLRAGAGSLQPRTHHSQTQAAPGKGQPRGLGWDGSLQKRVIPSPAVGDNPSDFKETSGGAAECPLQWVIRAEPNSAVLAPLWPQGPQPLTFVTSSCGPPVPFPFFLFPSIHPPPAPPSFLVASAGAGRGGSVRE